MSKVVTISFFSIQYWIDSADDGEVHIALGIPQLFDFLRTTWLDSFDLDTHQKLLVEKGIDNLEAMGAAVLEVTDRFVAPSAEFLSSLDVLTNAVGDEIGSDVGVSIEVHTFDKADFLRLAMEHNLEAI